MLFKLKSWHTIGSLHHWLNLSFKNCRKWLIMCISDLKDKTPHRPQLQYLRNYFNLVYTFARRSNQSILKEISPGCSMEGRMLKLKLPILWPPDVKNWLIWKKSWLWERLKAGGEGDNRGWHGWIASLTQWTWIWVNSGNWWWTAKPDVLHSIESQRFRRDFAIAQQLYI